MPWPRYHTTLFVPIEKDGKGHLHHVTGDITSSNGMEYDKKFRDAPEESQTFFSKELLGYTDVQGYPGSWDRVLKRLPTPPQQKAFNMKTMKNEPFKTRSPLTFYEPGEPRKPLWKCTEWTLEYAIPALKKEGLIH